MNQQETIDALAEQNRLLREALTCCLDDSRQVLSDMENNYGTVHFQRAIQRQRDDVGNAVAALILPDLSTSILNQRDARTLREAADEPEFMLMIMARQALISMAAEKEKV